MPDDAYATSSNQYGIIMPILIQDNTDEDLSGNGDEEYDQVEDEVREEVVLDDEPQVVIN